MSEPKEPPFKVGDLVEHRASGERGVVTKLRYGCSNPEHRGAFNYACATQPHKCKRDIYSGMVDLSIGLSGDNADGISDMLLRKVEE